MAICGVCGKAIGCEDCDEKCEMEGIVGFQCTCDECDILNKDKMPNEFRRTVTTTLDQIYDELPDNIKQDPKKAFMMGVYSGYKLKDLFSSFAVKITLGFLERMAQKGDD